MPLGEWRVRGGLSLQEVEVAEVVADGGDGPHGVFLPAEELVEHAPLLLAVLFEADAFRVAVVAELLADFFELGLHQPLEVQRDEVLELAGHLLAGLAVVVLLDLSADPVDDRRHHEVHRRVSG